MSRILKTEKAIKIQFVVVYQFLFKRAQIEIPVILAVNWTVIIRNIKSKMKRTSIVIHWIIWKWIKSNIFDNYREHLIHQKLLISVFMFIGNFLLKAPQRDSKILKCIFHHMFIMNISIPGEFLAFCIDSL